MGNLVKNGRYGFVPGPFGERESHLTGYFQVYANEDTGVPVICMETKEGCGMDKAGYVYGFGIVADLGELTTMKKRTLETPVAHAAHSCLTRISQELG